ncbi:conserved unknown protein [Ectocarpus siliculosus]|uniref:Lipoyl-binding domain-containing protein n=1 Tax=Ectocarpus siliculosus TaxID=2880 RepID=D7FGX3_ECTSI|nr:conserved unknown protein [Ectocarpus siliculosus]|eukprot:CBJ48962.1 conserved unknown protein [Ectocarpus siliculosus]
MRARWVHSSVRGLRCSRAGVVSVRPIMDAVSGTRSAHTFRPWCMPEQHVAQTGTSSATAVSPTCIPDLALRVNGRNGRISAAKLGTVRRLSNEARRGCSTQVQPPRSGGPMSALSLRPSPASVLVGGPRTRALGATLNGGVLCEFSTSSNGTTVEKGVDGAPVAEAEVAEVAMPAKEEPRHAHIEMPTITEAERVATLTSWKVQVGDVIEVGDVVCEIELEQFSVGVKVETPGFLAEILVEAGTEGVPVGTDIGTIVHSEEEIALYQQAQAHESEDKEVKADTEVIADPAGTFSWKDVLKDVLRLRNGGMLSEGESSTLMSLARNKDSELLQAFEGCFEGDKYKGDIDDDLFLAQAKDIFKTRRNREAEG